MKKYDIRQEGIGEVDYVREFTVELSDDADPKALTASQLEELADYCGVCWEEYYYDKIVPERYTSEPHDEHLPKRLSLVRFPIVYEQYDEEVVVDE